MIDIASLVEEELQGNFFAPDAYVQGDFELGLIENRNGSRLIALPEVLIQAIYAGLEQEVGSATGVVLFNCGRWWGKIFYRRFSEELEGYYGKSLAQMEMAEFLQSFKECWKTHGWGVLEWDLNYYDHGFLVFKTTNSPFAEATSAGEKPVCFVEAGILSAFFSQLTGRELHCVQTSCESRGDECNHFVIGLTQRVKPAEAWSDSHDTVVERLVNNA
jgi:predicted hydrocarbon binding protein